MIEIVKNKWKYSTIGLMTVLAVGFSFPQAFAHVTNSLTHNVQHILEAIANLQADVDALAEKSDASAEKLGDKLDVVKCNSPIRSKVDLSGCDLSLATLNSAMLNRADLSDADLHSINLISASLVAADLSGADLSSATLIDASLPFADLSGADLSSANFKDADLTFADLSGATLLNANFEGTLLGSADFNGCVGDPVGTPSTGTLPDCE